MLKLLIFINQTAYSHNYILSLHRVQITSLTLTTMVLNRDLSNFAAFRKWFNRQFSLSLNGKFVGLSRLGDSLLLFAHKLYKLLHRSKRMRPLGDVLVLSINHNIIKLYNR